MLAGVALFALLALALAIDAGVRGPGAVPDVVRTAAVTLALLVACGLGAARLLVPAAWWRFLPLFVLPVGAAVCGLVLAVLGILGLPLRTSLVLLLGGSAVLALVAHRRVRAPEGAERDRVADVLAPLAVAALVGALALLPVFRAGFATVQGQNGDAVLAVGTAELLRVAPPDAVRPELPLDSVPLVWRSKLPIYYVLAAVSELGGQDPIVVFPTVGAVALALAALGFALFARIALRAPPLAGLAVLALLPLDRIVLHTAIHPYYNQTWALLALPFVLLTGWWALIRPGPRSLTLAGTFLALALFAYPLLLPFPALFLGVVAWRRRDAIRLPAIRLPRLPRRRWMLVPAALLALPVLAVLGRGVAEKVVSARAILPGGDLRGWSGPGLPYLPFGRFFGIDEAWWIVVPGVAALLALGWIGVRGATRDVAVALRVLVAAGLLAAAYLRLRGQTELFWFKALGFLGPIVVAAAIAGLARLPARAGVAGVAVLAAVFTLGTRREVAVTYEFVTKGLLELRAWDRALPADLSVRIDVPPSGYQLWSWYMLERRPVSVLRPLGGFFPTPPFSFKADLALVRRGDPRPPDAVGRPLRENREYLLYRVVPPRPGEDFSSRRLYVPITEVTL